MQMRFFILLAYFFSSTLAMAQALDELQLGKRETLYLANCKNELRLSRAKAGHLILTISSGKKCSELVINGSPSRFGYSLSSGFSNQKIKLEANVKQHLIKLSSKNGLLSDSFVVKTQDAIVQPDGFLFISPETRSVVLPQCQGSLSVEDGEDYFHLILEGVKGCDQLVIHEAYGGISGNAFELAGQKEIKLYKNHLRGFKSITLQLSGTTENSSGFPILLQDDIIWSLLP